MNRDDRKKLTANELYLNECMSILYTKIKATGFNMFGEDGSVSLDYIINVENYQHGTVTYGCKPSSIKVNYDGTNFAPKFIIDKKNNGFIYKLKPLDIEYICNDRLLDEIVHEKKVMRTAGKSVDYYRYLSCGTFFLLIEHYSVDENGKVKVVDANAVNFNDDELLDYLYEQMAKSEEFESRYSDEDDEISEEESEMIENEVEDSKPIRDLISENFNQREIEEIDAYADDESYDDMCEIDYSLVDILKDKLSDESYQCDYPERIEDFDYQKYIKDIQNQRLDDGTEQLVYSSNPDFDADVEDGYEVEGDYEAEDDSEVEDGYEDEYDESKDLYSLSDSAIDEEGFIDDSCFAVKINGEEVDDERKQDIVDFSVTGIMDVDQEVTALKDYYVDIVRELRKMRAIITKRRELVKQRSIKKNSSDVSDGGDEEERSM